MSVLATLSMASSILSLLCLLVLHFTSPEYKPSWRMISEYALGNSKWLITAFFLFWGAGSILLSLLLYNVVTGIWATLGVLFLFISGIGEIMGGLFDLKHKHHGLAFLLGVPALPLAALLIGYHLVNLERWQIHKTTLLLSTHATWLSLIIMAIAMRVMFSGFKKAGIQMSQDAEPPEHVPPGVIALGGYANRLLVICYIGWSLLVAFYFMNA